jgi:hypothetical protein
MPHDRCKKRWFLFHNDAEYYNEQVADLQSDVASIVAKQQWCSQGYILDVSVDYHLEEIAGFVLSIIGRWSEHQNRTSFGMRDKKMANWACAFVHGSTN